MPSILPLVRENLRLIEQGRGVLRTLERGLYARPAPELRLAAAGGHFRHCIEFYDAFLCGLDDLHVDYDARQRDARIEGDPALADVQLGRIARELQAIGARDAATQLSVRPECADEHDPSSESSLARELHFLASHTVHHYALIAVVLRLHGYDPGPRFGIAPSTLEHLEQSLLEDTGACAP